MFHIMPDDTGTSAIWVAQRVPDDHITVVANAFVIGEVNIDDAANFMGSANLFDIAIRNNLWSRESGKPFNFALVYGTNRHTTAYACTRRIWRVLTRAAPSLLPQFSAYTDGLQTFGFGADGKLPYPFSVKPDHPLTIQDIMNMNRDQFENTDFDMSNALDAGPFGDTMRYPPTSVFRDAENGITYDEYQDSLGQQRPISLFRTAYSTVTQARSNLPDIVGAVTWICQYAPHHSSFVPVYANAPQTPSSLNVGTQCK
jgi:dipeptidase